MSTFERGFAVLVVVVAATLAGVTVAPATSASEPTVAFDPGVPESYDFEPVTESGTAIVDGTQYDSVQRAVDAADPGDTVVLRGRFDERVVVNTTGVTLTSVPGTLAVIDGGGDGDVLTIDAANVTIRRVWIRNSGYDASSNDAGVWVDAPNVTLVDNRISEITFGIWIDGVPRVTVRNTTIVGRDSVTPRSYRGNGIQVWKAEDAVIVGNRITDARDGIYFSWADNVTARNNSLWNLRYGVHYMYSDDCRLVNNVAFDNDVGYALMLSENIRVVNNTAINNTGTSAHGILLKRIDHSVVTGNDVVANGNGLYVFNSVGNRITGNLVLENRVGIHLTAGSESELVSGNSFINNDRSVLAVIGKQVAWNASDQGNYWSGARRSDVDHDGINELRHRPAGLVEYLVHQHPQAAVFSASPAFDAIRRAESTLPVVEAPGVVDHHPLANPPHQDWRRYYARNRSQ